MLKSFIELFQYRQLVANLVATDLKVRYRRSFLGLLWTLLNPLLLMLVMWVVFKKFGRVDEKSYAMFLLAGLMVWIFFQQAVSQSLGSIVKNRALIQKIYVPKLVFPVSTVLSNLVNTAFFLLAYHMMVVFSPVGLQPTAPFVLLSLLMALILASGVGLVMGALNVFFRDFQHLTQVGLRALFYLTPVLYRPGIFSPKVNLILRLNPVFYPVVTGRDAIYEGVISPMEDWVIGFSLAIIVLLAGALVFSATEKKFVYYA